MAEVGRSSRKSETEQQTDTQRAKGEKSLLDWEVVVVVGELGGQKGEGVGKTKKKKTKKKEKKKGGFGVVEEERLASLKSPNPLTSVAGAKMEDHTAF